MANDLEHADDVSAMMEALWGPRTEVPPHVASGPGSRSNADGTSDGPDDVERASADPLGSPSSKARGSADDFDGDIHQELALIEAWERESSERLAALEHAVGSELERLSQTVEASHDGLAARADLESLRGEVADRMAASLSDVEARMVTQAGLAEFRAEVRAEMVEQLRLVFDEALKQGDARAGAVAAELSRRQEALVGKDEFAVLRSELRDELSRNMAAAQAELQRRAALLGAAIVDARTHMGERLDQMAALVSTEAARAAEQATARAGVAAEALHRELRALQEQVQHMSTVVAALQRRLPAS